MNPRIDQLLDQWESAHENGIILSPEELCTDWPEGVEELRQQMKALKWIDRVLELPTSPELGPPDLPGYEFGGELGRGGWGVVYRARHTQLQCEHAVKVIRSQIARMPGAVERFLHEARTLARLQGPNIVPVYHADVHEGRPYFVMQLIEGGSLANQLAAYRKPQAAAELIEQVARAVHLAHQHQILHRDLKPANILLTANGRPLVSDFGLAKLLDRPPTTDDTSTLSQSATDAQDTPAQLVTREGVGTPLYMAPEQFAGYAKLLSPATDVWALGVILYELLTGKRPFAGDLGELRTAITTQEPVPPRTLAPQMSRRLEQVVLRCLRKDPKQRYPSAAALANALARTTQPILRRWHGMLAAICFLSALVVTLVVNTQDWSEWNYQRATAPITSTLGNGGSRELIVPGTVPPHRWRFGHGDARWDANAAPAGVLSVTTLGPALLELLPDPGCDHYRVDFRLRQEEIYNPMAFVAVYVGHQPVQSPSANLHFVTCARFADFGSRTPQHGVNKDMREGEFAMKLAVLGATATQPWVTSDFPIEEWLIPYQIPAYAKLPGPDREISIRVKGDRVESRCIWEQQTVGHSMPKALAVWQKDKLHLSEQPIVWHPRGGMGLFLYGCRLSVEKIHITSETTN